MRIASITMAGQFPDGIGLHARNLRWALAEEDHIYIITPGSFIKNHDLQNNARVTYIDFGESQSARMFLPFWKEFPGIVTRHRIEPEYFLFMEQDIWFHETIKDDPLPDAKEIRSYLPLHNYYHAVMTDHKLCHPRVWEGGMLMAGPVVSRAIGFGIDFSAHANCFINRDKKRWDTVAGGAISFGEFERPDTMDEFALFCALVEKTRATTSAKAVHLQGPETLHRFSPELYNDTDQETLRTLAERSRYHFCVYTAVAAYFIAGKWEKEVDWTRIQPRFKPAFRKLIRTGEEWMNPDEFERLERIVARL